MKSLLIAAILLVSNHAFASQKEKILGYWDAGTYMGYPSKMKITVHTDQSILINHCPVFSGNETCKTTFPLAVANYNQDADAYTFKEMHKHQTPKFLGWNYSTSEHTVHLQVSNNGDELLKIVDPYSTPTVTMWKRISKSEFYNE